MAKWTKAQRAKFQKTMKARAKAREKIGGAIPLDLIPARPQTPTSLHTMKVDVVAGSTLAITVGNTRVIIKAVSEKEH